MSIIGVIGVVTLITIGLHALGDVPGLSIDWHHPVASIDHADPSDAVGAALRYVGLAIAYWVLATTALYYASGLWDRRRRPHWLASLTLPPIRRLIDRALATSLVLTIATAPVGPLHAEGGVSPEPPPVVFELGGDGIPVPHVTGTAPVDETGGEARDETVAGTDDGAPASHGDVAEPSAPQTTEEMTDPDATVESEDTEPPAPITAPVVVATPTSPLADDDNPAVEPTDTTHIVVTGDNLWSISAGHLLRLRTDTPSESDIAEYWRTVVAANSGTLRSGDPNLIYPGEIVTLPAPGVSE